MITKRKAMVVLSGGQDSTTCLMWAKARYDEVHAITFDYGQKHRAEIHSAERVAALVGVSSHTVVNAAGMLKGRSPLVNPDVQLETYTDFNSMDSTIGNRIELTFVPLRNLLFLVIAANHALAKDCFDLVTGVCAMDNANYPDCTEAFILSAQSTIREALGMHRPDMRSGPQIEIVTPLLFLSKAETVDLARQFPDWEAVMAESHTCYAGSVPPCGKCHACVLRAEGFRQAGVADPLVEKWHVLGGVLKGEIKQPTGMTMGRLSELEENWQDLSRQPAEAAKATSEFGSTNDEVRADEPKADPLTDTEGGSPD